MPLAGSRVRPADWGIDRRTIEVYERQAGDYARNRPPAHRERARLLAARCLPGLPVADLGCGPGGYASDLGATGAAVIGVDAARAMIALARDAERAVLGDLESLPLGLGVLGGAWARNSYLHVPPARLPLALAHLHHAMADGAPLVASVGAGEDFTSSDDLPGRAFFGWSASTLGEVMAGAGFVEVEIEAVGPTLWVSAARGHTLPDFVGPGMRLLICGLNPSLPAAAAGYGFAGPGNRFWRAARLAGLLSRLRDPWDALSRHGIGMTDLVKRATRRSAELERDEYRDGWCRLVSLVGRLRPGRVCFVGLEGWRAAVDPSAAPGWQPGRVAGVAAYLMPSTSGLNARSSLDELAGHLRQAVEGKPPVRSGTGGRVASRGPAGLGASDVEIHRQPG